MDSKSPRVSAFLQKEHVAHDALWVIFAEQLDAENAELRTMLALAHCGTSLYHDDGELQDTRDHPWIDWRRDTVSEIRIKLAVRATQNLSRAEAAERLGYGLSND